MKINLCKEFYYRVRQKDTLENISCRFNTDKSNLIRNNSNIDLYPGEWIIVKQNEFKSHHVKPMETLELIADKYGITVEKLITDNKLNDKKVFIGQMLKIY